MFRGFSNKVAFVIHELAHAKVGVTDIVYGIPDCKKLSKENPHLAANNAEGIDAAITLQDGATYLFKGNFFVKFNNVVGENLSQRFPSLLSWCFKDFPGTFAQGFDSFVCHKAFGRTLATKGADRVHSI